MDFDFSSIVGIIITIIGSYFQYKVSRNKINQRKNKDDKPTSFDWIDVLVSYVIEFVEKRKSDNAYKKKNLAEFTRLTRLIEAINRKYLPNIIGVVKVNGTEKLIIDLTEDNKLVDISKHFGSGLLQEANDELLLDEGLYIPSVVKYKGDDDLVAILHDSGVTECHFLPFMELGLMTGYLILGYTSLGDTRVSEDEFRLLKERINKVRINFRKT